ncbi:hypothetical protein CC_2719 [Caulobacter vibrioides CB15]|uniref:Uncharacterized protein n=1 Tax=Caulobacter vibrioides (strain ATCC 19089 / CIP 103742 / CB 15) TaxID=190650 RepID=Q9A4V6_CAUVC|nr:hypothetical protein CC_2719 [Caulobacter vibrioides CB15]ATC29556.1 hypothetical protein CA607_14690 [Caulobacter vibrioides]
MDGAEHGSAPQSAGAHRITLGRAVAARRRSATAPSPNRRPPARGAPPCAPWRSRAPLANRARPAALFTRLLTAPAHDLGVVACDEVTPVPSIQLLDRVEHGLADLDEGGTDTSSAPVFEGADRHLATIALSHLLCCQELLFGHGLLPWAAPAAAEDHGGPFLRAQEPYLGQSDQARKTHRGQMGRTGARQGARGDQ